MIRRSTRALQGALVLSMLAAAGAAAQPAGSQKVRLVLRPESRLWIEGGSNLHDWKCDAKSVVAEVTITREAPRSDPTGVQSGTLTVPAAALECGNDKMNENLRKALKANQHAEIRFVVTGA